MKKKKNTILHIILLHSPKVRHLGKHLSVYRPFLSIYRRFWISVRSTPCRELPCFSLLRIVPLYRGLTHANISWRISQYCTGYIRSTSTLKVSAQSNWSRYVLDLLVLNRVNNRSITWVNWRWIKPVVTRVQSTCACICAQICNCVTSRRQVI